MIRGNLPAQLSERNMIMALYKKCRLRVYPKRLIAFIRRVASLYIMQHQKVFQRNNIQSIAKSRKWRDY